MELDQKYRLVDWACTVLDIWCAPWSRLQYLSNTITHPDPTIIWLDLKNIDLTIPHVAAYEQDVTDMSSVIHIFESHEVKQFDLIVSDMAPDTIGMSDIDALRSIWLIEKTLWIYEQYLASDGRFAIKVFMWPWFDELVRDLKQQYGSSSIVTYKPKSCRPKSKEMYIVKRS